MGRHAGTQFFYAMTPSTLPQDSPFGRGIHAAVNVALKRKEEGRKTALRERT